MFFPQLARRAFAVPAAKALMLFNEPLVIQIGAIVPAACHSKDRLSFRPATRGSVRRARTAVGGGAAGIHILYYITFCQHGKTTDLRLGENIKKSSPCVGEKGQIRGCFGKKWMSKAKICRVLRRDADAGRRQSPHRASGQICDVFRRRRKIPKNNLLRSCLLFCGERRQPAEGGSGSEFMEFCVLPFGRNWPRGKSHTLRRNAWRDICLPFPRRTPNFSIGLTSRAFHRRRAHTLERGGAGYVAQ